MSSRPPSPLYRSVYGGSLVQCLLCNRQKFIYSKQFGLMAMKACPLKKWVIGVTWGAYERIFSLLTELSLEETMKVAESIVYQEK